MFFVSGKTCCPKLWFAVIQNFKIKGLRRTAIITFLTPCTRRRQYIEGKYRGGAEYNRRGDRSMTGNGQGKTDGGQGEENASLVTAATRNARSRPLGSGRGGNLSRAPEKRVRDSVKISEERQPSYDYSIPSPHGSKQTHKSFLLFPFEVWERCRGIFVCVSHNEKLEKKMNSCFTEKNLPSLNESDH